MIRAPAAASASFVAAVVGVALAGATPAPADAPAPVVRCYDESRDVVTPMLRSECEGRIVDAEEAELIRRARIERIRAGMAARENKLFPGTSLRSAGTGFFVDDTGTLLTNDHVTRNCKQMTVETPDGQRARGEVLANSKTLDLSLVRSDQPPKASARFSSVEVQPGLRADLIGYPTQGIAPEKPIFSAGEVAQHQTRFNDPHRFLVQADVRSGNSGGPVLDGSGLVLGVVFAQVNTPKLLKRTGETLPDLAVVVRNEAVRDFLRAHGVKVEVAAQAPVLARDRVEAEARDYVARIACWR